MRNFLFSVLIGLPLIGGCQALHREPEAVGPVKDVSLKAVTFNIRFGSAQDGPDRWENRKENVVETIRDFDADVLGLQEALAFQADELREALPEYGMVFTGRDDGRRAGESCPILYRRDRFKLTDAGTFWFSQTPTEPGSKDWGNTLPRICTWVLLRDLQADRDLYVYNLHLDHQSQPSREKGLELLAERIIGRAPEAPVVVMGDFNIRLDNPAMRVLLGKGCASCLRLADTWRSAHPGENPVGTFHGFTGNADPETGVIDHILVSDTTPVVEAGIERRSFDGRWPSDHFPVFATVKPYSN